MTDLLDANAWLGHYPAIGRALNRDHSAIIQAERRTR